MEVVTRSFFVSSLGTPTPIPLSHLCSSSPASTPIPIIPSPGPTQGSRSPNLALVRDPRPQFLTPFFIRLRFRVCNLHARLSFQVPGVPFSFPLPSDRKSVV